MKENVGRMEPERENFYGELTTRNGHFISSGTQQRLRALKIVIAGCGSTGGACIESLARLGVENFIIADNGKYELNNLNRQHAYVESIGCNKARFHADQLRKINPYVHVTAHEEGVTQENLPALVEWADLIMDAVDVTTLSGVAMKLALHERAKSRGKPVLTALDIGYCQWGRSYDYRKAGLKALDGRLEAARKAGNPMSALFSFVPLSVVPPHALPLIEDLLVNKSCSASQLGCTSDLLSAIIVPAVIRFVETGELVPGWNINLEALAMPWSLRVRLWFQAIPLRLRIQRLLQARR